MENKLTKKSFLLFIAFAISFTCIASNEILPKQPTGKSIELTQINHTTIHVKTSVVSLQTEYYIIERSYNNKDFKTIAVLFPFEQSETIKAIQLKDKIKEGTKTVYYRIQKVENDVEIIIANEVISVK